MNRFPHALLFGVTLSILFAACSRDDETTPDVILNDGLVDTSFVGFQGKVGPEKNTWIQGQNTFSAVDSQRIVLANLPDTSRSRYFSAIINGDGSKYLRLAAGDLGFIVSKTPTGEDFFDFFGSNFPSYAFTGPFVDTAGTDTAGNPILDTNTIEVPGLEITFKNISSVVWSSRYGAQPLGSDFRIVNSREVRSIRGIEFFEFEAEFNVTLFDTNSANTLQIKDATYIGQFRNE